ncbi:hypothetical protein HGRIS_009771 [Hohenbuehelia grisea]|uniref:Uncharacterized protein n=1 Tax=Hohenbuehelia grisea TaxID=104357 RepID=A0ABR3J2G3_9AGAR
MLGSDSSSFVFKSSRYCCLQPRTRSCKPWPALSSTMRLRHSMGAQELDAAAVLINFSSKDIALLSMTAGLSRGASLDFWKDAGLKEDWLQEIDGMASLCLSSSVTSGLKSLLWTTEVLEVCYKNGDSRARRTVNGYLGDLPDKGSAPKDIRP